MTPWISESNQGKQLAVSILSTVVGVVLAYGFRKFSGAGSNELAGFLLGLLLLGIGVAGLFTCARQTITIDPKRRSILIEDKGPLRTQKRSIRFDEIVDIGIGYLGKRSNGVTFYYLALELKNGESYPLFAPGRFFAGSDRRDTVEGWRDRLWQYIGR